MEKTYSLQDPFYWTRERAVPIRKEILGLMDALGAGDVLALDTRNVQAFDFSFAAELFEGLIKHTRMGDGHFLAVDGLTEYNRENLHRALESLDVCVIARHDGVVELLGKVNVVDAETFAVVAKHPGPITAAALQERLGVSLNATNERLKKLLGLGLIRRTSARSAAGREQFLYHTLS